MISLRKVLPVRSGEGFVTAVMFAYIFAVLFAYYILDPLRKAMFLSKIPTDQLPYAYFLTAVIAGTIATLTLRMSRRWSAPAMITVVNALIIGTLFYFRGAVGGEIPWYLPWVYFCYVKTVSVLSAAQFWLLAGYVYDSRQAKRLYGLLGTGAIVGAIAGSYVAGFVENSTESMLLTCVVVYSILIVLSYIAWRHRRTNPVERTRPEAERKPREGFNQILPAIWNFPHLRLMSALIFLTAIASQIADWQLDVVTQRVFAGDDVLIRYFFGQFNFVTNILALLMQLFLTNYLIQHMGVLAATILLPACLFLSSGGFLLYPSLAMASLPRGSDTVFRYSLNRAGLEMLYMPLAPSIRGKLKLFVDVVLDRAGRAVAGIVILILIAFYGDFASRGTAGVAMVLTFLSIVVCLRLGRTYVSAFRRQLARREVEFDDVPRYVSDPAGVQALVSALEGTNERQILYALGLLQSARRVDFSAQLLPLLRHSSAHIREAAVRTLHALPQNQTAAVEPLLYDESDDVLVASVSYLCSVNPANSLARLRALLRHEQIRVRIAAAHWVAANPVPGFMPSLESVNQLCEIAEPHAAKARSAAAALSVQLPDAEAVDVLGRLIGDADPAVVQAAAVAAGSSGNMKPAYNIAVLLADGKRRAAARAGLLRYGAQVLGVLGDVLRDTRITLELRREIPWVLSRIPSQRSVDTLTDHLASEDSTLRFRVVKALNRLHETSEKLKMPSRAIEQAIQDEVRFYHQALAMRRILDSGLLSRALQERMDQGLEIIFRLLGLEYPQKDIYFAYLALKERQPGRRIAAIEFLDNTLHRSLKPLILPVLEESSIDVLLERGRKLFGIEDATRDEVLGRLLNQNDAWLKSCALHEIGERRIGELKEFCRNLAEDENPVVKQTAGWALARCM